MSTSDENILSTVQPAPIVEVLLPKELTLVCGICESNIAATENHITCAKAKCGKVTCSECFRTMIGMLLAMPTIEYPLKCGTCRTTFKNTDVESMVIALDHYEKYIACILPLYWSQNCLNDYEALVQCPFCPYLEIHTTDACAIQFLSCQNPNCGKRSCLICLNAVKDDDDESVHRHRCSEYHSSKKLIEDAIKNGSVRNCPYCHLGGIKDENCTHMCCPRCRNNWCYFCGKKEEDCEGDSYGDNNLSSHNNDWQTNPDRCPMYLQNIVEIDSRWPDDNEECVDFFHRCLILRNLNEVLEDIGEEALSDLNSEFDILKAHGYSIDDIKDEDNRILIKYN